MDGEKTAEPESPIYGKKTVFKIVLVLLSLFLYAFFMETLGFIPVTLLLFIFLFGMIEKKRWGFAVLVSVVVTGVSYLVLKSGSNPNCLKGYWGS